MVHTSPGRYGRLALLVSALKMPVLMLALGCTVDRTVATARLDAGELEAGSQAELDQRWGQFVATLGIAACIDGGVLTVESAGDELGGGTSLNARANAGATLPFREALFIAANSPGPHRILFDSTTFTPGSAPTIVIIDAGVPFPPPLTATCIDARDRAVVIDFRLRTGDSQRGQPCMFSLGAGSQMTGLVINGDPQPL